MTPFPQLPPPPQPPHPLTAEEFANTYPGDSFEYVNGRVRRVNTGGALHGMVCATTAFVLTDSAEAARSGRVFLGNVFTCVPTADDPERVYGPDVAYVGYDRFPEDCETPDGVLPATPHLVAEVLMPSDVAAEMAAKVDDYLGVGIGVVLVIDPDTETVAVYRHGIPSQHFGPGDTLTFPDVLPGFAVAVAELFE